MAKTDRLKTGVAWPLAQKTDKTRIRIKLSPLFPETCAAQGRMRAFCFVEKQYTGRQERTDIFLAFFDIKITPKLHIIKGSPAERGCTGDYLS